MRHQGDSPVKRPTRSLRAEATDLVIPTQADFEHDLTARCREAVRATIQVVLDEELERLVGAGRYEHSDQRVDVRNGAYPRRVVTTAGEVELRVGRTRHGGAATAPLGRYARRRPEIDQAITQAYVGGVSTRDMAGVTEALLDKRVGRSTVSRVTRRLDDEVEALRRAPITEPIAYLSSMRRSSMRDGRAPSRTCRRSSPTALPPTGTVTCSGFTSASRCPRRAGPRARCASSPPSRSRRPASGATASTSTCPCWPLTPPSRPDLPATRDDPVHTKIGT